MNPKLYIDRKRLLKNFSFIKSKTDSNFVCPMVKANAYGVGDSIVVAQLLEAGAQHFGVARVSEGEKLRRFFPNTKFEILVFCPMSSSDVESYVHNGLSPVVCTLADLEVLKEQPLEVRKKIKPLHLKFDLGMNRFGFKPSQAGAIKEALYKMGLKLAGVCGHFPDGREVAEQGSVAAQSLEDLVRAAQVFGLKETQVHAPNTETLMSSDKFKVGLRPGISLYGLFDEKRVEGLSGVLSLKAPLVSVKSISEGAGVSYKSLWRAEEETQIGALPIGYADGLRRGLSNRMQMRGASGALYPQVGAICMDFCMVNLGAHPQESLGDEISLFDSDYTQLYRWSSLLGTIPYEILTGLGERIERTLI